MFKAGDLFKMYDKKYQYIMYINTFSAKDIGKYFIFNDISTPIRSDMLMEALEDGHVKYLGNIYDNPTLKLLYV